MRTRWVTVNSSSISPLTRGSIGGVEGEAGGEKKELTEEVISVIRKTYTFGVERGKDGVEREGLEKEEEEGRYGRECTVCLGEYEKGEILGTLHTCGHSFHKNCIDAWLQSNVSCPLCRTILKHKLEEKDDNNMDELPTSTLCIGPQLNIVTENCNNDSLRNGTVRMNVDCSNNEKSGWRGGDTEKGERGDGRVIGEGQRREKETEDCFVDICIH